MPGDKKAVLDSNIIIDISKGDLSEELILVRYQRLCISIISWMEVLGFSFQTIADRKAMETFVSRFHIYPIDGRVAQKVVEIRTLRKVKLPDAIILGTAWVHGCDIITRDERDFAAFSGEIPIIHPKIFI